jgi:hypothetical protein
MAVSVTAVGEETLNVEIVALAEVAPAGTKTLAGVFAAVGTELLSGT